VCYNENAVKLDLKKELASFYHPSSKNIVVVDVPVQRVISIEGKGDPNTSPEFAHAISALFPIAYTIKFACKKLGKDFAVMPLEGLWWMEHMKDFSIENKEKWLWKLFIVQPDFVTKQHFHAAVEHLKKKEDKPSFSRVIFETLHEGQSAQILYIGPYAEEGPTIHALHDFIREQGCTFNGLKQKHHEIYLSDMRKTAPSKLKTIIRQAFSSR